MQSHNILARYFPALGPLPVPASLPEIPANKLTPEDEHGDNRSAMPDFFSIVFTFL